MKCWYTVHTKPHAEYRVEAALQQRSIKTYLPTSSFPERKPQPFFPCYLFMRVDLDILPAWQWQWIPGLKNMVSFDGRPAQVSSQTIALIQRKLQELANDPTAPPASRFQPGDSVRITQGPLQDMVAVFNGPLSAANRVQVLLTFLGRTSRVWLEENTLEKTSSNSSVSAAKPRRRTRGRGRRIRN